MCYYKTYLYLTCGHVSLSRDPVHRSQCPNQRRRSTISNPSTLPPPSLCTDTLHHPLHTFGMDKLCPPCQDDRDARLESFGAYMREEFEKRILARSAERNERGCSRAERGRRLFRASTTLPMVLEPAVRLDDLQRDGRNVPRSERGSSSVAANPTQEAVGKIVGGWRDVVGWSEAAHQSTRAGRRASVSKSHSPSPSPCQSRQPLTRLSFAAFGGAAEVVDVVG